MSDIKAMSIKDFRTLGFLQEANRLFFHPLGLALSVSIDLETGNESFGPIWDYREDPEGIIFSDNVINSDKIKYVDSLRDSKRAVREELLGDIIQQMDKK